MEDETPAAVEDDAPAATDEAASETGAPAPPPDDGYEKRYADLRTEFDRRNSLLDRARQGDAEAASELGFEFAEQEPDPGDEEQTYGEEPAETADPVARQWIEQQQVKENLALFNSHLDRLAGGPELLDDWDRQALLNASIAGGFNEQATEKAFAQWKERNDTREKAQFEKWKKSKQAPHVSASGTGATEVPFRDDMSLRELTKAAQEQARLLSEQ